MYSPTKKRTNTIKVIFTLRGIQRRFFGGPCTGPSASIALMLSRLRVAEAAEVLGLDRTRTYALVSAGELPSIRVGGAGGDEGA